jgi:5-methylcytosine-specific restriction endonuclease McrA
MHSIVTVKDRIPLETVLSEVPEVVRRYYNKEMKKALKRIMFDDYFVKVESLRLLTFKAKGIKCSCCGIEGKFFALERKEYDKVPHFNMYAEKDGERVLMTKDHIIPKSKGGKDRIENMQTMCWRCNRNKADNVGNLI